MTCAEGLILSVMTIGPASQSWTQICAGRELCALEEQRILKA
jgi:hypothetical protein